MEKTIASLQAFLSFLPRAPKFPLPLPTPAMQANYFKSLLLPQRGENDSKQSDKIQAIQSKYIPRDFPGNTALYLLSNDIRGRKKEAHIRPSINSSNGFYINKLRQSAHS